MLWPEIRSVSLNVVFFCCWFFSYLFTKHGATLVSLNFFLFLDKSRTGVVALDAMVLTTYI